VQRREADEALDQLHEVLDERFEAGPAAYVISTMTAQPAGDDDWAVEVVYTPDDGAPVHGLRVPQLQRADGEGTRSPLDVAWDIYRRLEAGAPDGVAPGADGVVWITL